MRPFFKPEDFEMAGYTDCGHQALADHLNKLLKARGVRVYGTKYESKKGWVFDEQGILPNETIHQALLINIEELPKQECAHEANWWKIDNGASMAYEPICYKCKIKLKASWSPA